MVYVLNRIDIKVNDGEDSKGKNWIDVNQFIEHIYGFLSDKNKIPTKRISIILELLYRIHILL